MLGTVPPPCTREKRFFFFFFDVIVDKMVGTIPTLGFYFFVFFIFSFVFFIPFFNSLLYSFFISFKGNFNIIRTVVNISRVIGGWGLRMAMANGDGKSGTQVMMMSVVKRCSVPVTFWLLENFLSPSFKESARALAEEFGSV